MIYIQIIKLLLNLYDFKNLQLESFIYLNSSVTHGCIIAIVRLFDCNGDEVLAPETSTCMINRETDSQLPVVSAPLVNSYQLFQLQQYIREAVHREKIIEQKLSTLENILFTTEKATESSWQVLIFSYNLVCYMNLVIFFRRIKNILFYIYLKLF